MKKDPGNSRRRTSTEEIWIPKISRLLCVSFFEQESVLDPKAQQDARAEFSITYIDLVRVREDADDLQYQRNIVAADLIGNAGLHQKKTAVVVFFAHYISGRSSNGRAVYVDLAVNVSFEIEIGETVPEAEGIIQLVNIDPGDETEGGLQKNFVVNRNGLEIGIAVLKGCENTMHHLRVIIRVTSAS